MRVSLSAREGHEEAVRLREYKRRMRTRRFNKMSSTRNESQTPQVAKSPENQMTELLGQMTNTLTSLYVG